MSNTYSVRPVRSLNGLWHFSFLGTINVLSFDPASAAPTASELMPVPSAFDALPAYAGKRGAAVYRTTFSLTAGHAGRIEFGAVSMWGRVFIDGELVREHACGYAPFIVDVPEHTTRTARTLTVLVDNRFDFSRVPMHEEYFDFYQYGGILRDVVLHTLPVDGAFIERVLVTPLTAYREGAVEVSVWLGGEPSATVDLTIQFDHAPEQNFTSVPVVHRRATLTLQVPSPQIWSPTAPHLHALRVTLGRQDDTAVRFGLREIKARDGQLWLNGELLKLRGYNRHEWHPNFGPCTPTLQMVADIQLLRDLQCNFVRGSHYQQDQRFLDLCDEYGLLVWEENLGWGQREKTFASGKFAHDHAAALEAMVLHSYNHPSVIIWGCLNEARTDADYVRPILEESIARIRALDPSRLVSYASMFALTDKHFDLVDVISLNLYPGWYNAEDHPRPLDLIRPHLRECFAHLDAHGHSAKPVLISEIGAEALYGWHDAHHDFYTEEFQAAYVREACLETMSNPRCCGIALWHFSDVRTYGSGRAIKRPRAFNNKGTLDEYRRPKLAYAAVRAVFAAHARGESLT